MDTMTVIFKALEFLPRFMPRPAPPKMDYEALRQSYPRVEIGEPLHATEVTVTAPMSVRETPQLEHRVTRAPREQAEMVNEVATSCMACSRSHLSTVSGALNESLRFARDEGVESPEVQRRLMMAEDEINIMERIDLSAEAIQRSPEQEQELARHFLPRIRKVRQDLGQVASVEDLEKVAADSSMLSQEFRLSVLQSKGVDLNPVLALAKRVQSGELTMEQAKLELKKILPEEE